MPLASATGLTVSIAASTNAVGSTDWISSRILPETMRLMSSRSSMSWVWARVFRSMTSSPCWVCAAVIVPVRRRCDHPRMAFSGVRSSCDTVARNSSFIAFARSASPRANCSLSRSWRRSSAACRAAASARRCSVISRKVHTRPAGRPSTSWTFEKPSNTRPSARSSTPWLSGGAVAWMWAIRSR